MKLENASPYPARLLRTVVDERRMYGCVLVRVSHEVVGGELRPTEAQRWQVSPGPWEGPWGPMPGDRPLVRGGVDVMIFGAARAAKGRPVACIAVTVEVGSRWRSTLHAWGDRTWRRGLAGLVPGEAEPVREVPLTLARAYGGSDEWDGIQVAYVDNPAGRGFYLEEGRARGRPLPNLEDPEAPVRRWDDRPEPVGTGSCVENFGPRVRRGLELDAETNKIRRIRPSFFNDAFPGMIAPGVAGGEAVVVHGVREDGPLKFTLPDTPLRVEVRIGEHGGVRTPTIDQIGVEADAGLVFVTYRYPFRYVLTPHQRRACRLFLAA
jgi:hypothetical protein